ncbi:sodium:solute symporter [Phenylobacterium deserti]|uniref:Sodium transporter n=1 Tax=Phenylobacterium deserti TaxID=1914756 RepID=A0A328A8N0_9CAUL|nr:sodium:solute symporter [Phenylobacterium deserti]RAK50835.1 sodium transporter [Phenylobacterium deserti]
MDSGIQLLTGLDQAVIGLYLIGVVGVGLLVARRRAGTEAFFLNSRASKWPVIGLALVAANISSSTLVGLAGAAYANGISVYNYEWTAAPMIVLSCALVMPVILRARIFTMPEFLERRYAPFARTYFSALTILLNVLLDTAGTLFAGALMFRMLAPEVPLWQVAAVLAGITGLYSVTGGLRSLLATEVVQAVVLLVGGLVITVFAFQHAGGWHEVMTRVPPEKLSLIRPADDPAMPWTGLVIGIPIMGFYFWCSNQFMMQQVLSAQSLDQARWGSLFAALLKLPVLVFMVLPGAAALLIFPDLRHPDEVYPRLIFGLLPHGLMGLVIAGFLAAMMSTLASTYNAASTLLAMDFVARFRPKTSEAALVQTARWATAVFAAVSVAWVPVLEHASSSLMQYLQGMLSYTVPPIAALYVAGIFWPRANASGAAAALSVGALTGAALFLAIQVFHVLPMHFLIAAGVIFGFSLAALALVSLMTAPPDVERVGPMTFRLADWRAETEVLRSRPWFQNYRILSGLLLVLTAAVVWTFR